MTKFPHFRMNTKESPEEILTVNTNVDLIYVFDDVLDKTDLEEMQNFTWDWLPWDVRDRYSLAGGTSRFNFHVSNPIDPPFLTKSKIKLVNKIKNNLDLTAQLLAIGSEFAISSKPLADSFGQGIHRDCQELGSIWSVLIHVLGDSGPTEFFNNDSERKLVRSVEFKPGRMVLFPSLYSHRGCLPNEGQRIVMNSVCKMNFSKTQNIFDLSPELKKYLPQMI